MIIMCNVLVYEVTQCLLGSIIFLCVTVVYACIIIITSNKHELLKSAIIRWHLSAVNTFSTMLNNLSVGAEEEGMYC